MDVNEFIKNQGYITVPNPDYNPKSKKNKQPKTLDIIDLGANNNQLVDIVKKDLTNQETADREDVLKYEKQGLHWNAKDAASGSLDIQLADAQSNWAKFGNALAQTVVSEVGLGTLLGISDLFDAVGQAIGVSDHDYQNPVSRKLEEWQDKFNNEVAPIYSRPGSGFGEGTDFGWWMQNIPSIMSSLTLLIPSSGATKLMNLAGKAGREARAARLTSRASRLSKAAEGVEDASRAARMSKKAERWAKRADRLESGNLLGLSSKNAEIAKMFKDNATTAVISRTMENYQEARQVYDDMYSEVSESLNKMSDEEYNDFINKNQNTVEGIDTNNRDEVAKAVAKKSSDMTFKTDYANTVFDIIELYALKNIPFHGFRNSKIGTSARRLDKLSRRFAGKYSTLAELEELRKAQSFGRKALDLAEDVGHFAATKTYAQLSEGVEEAVNYIAQQEGMHVGHTMLGMEANTTFSNRLKEYVRNPELWESAFWGVAGGVVFQGLGSGLNRVQSANERKRELKKNQPNEKTGENVNAKTDWKSIWELPDVKRVKTSIEERLAIENNYRDIVNQINKGENPYIKGEKVETPEQKAVLLKKAQDRRRTSMILNAMDSGTSDMLRAYMEDENVKQALVDKGLITKEEADEVQREDLEAIDRIQEKYDKNVRILNHVSRSINRKKGVLIPTEYLQIIARNNIESQLIVEDYNEQHDRWSKEAADLYKELSDNGKLDENVNYRELIRLDILTRELGKVEAKKKQLLKNKEIANSISGKEALDSLNQEINTIRGMIANINPENKVSNLLYAIENSLAMEQTPRGYIFNGKNPEYLNFRQQNKDKNSEYFKNLDDKLVDIQESDFGQQEVIDQKMKDARNLNEDLKTAYATLAELEYHTYLERNNVKINENEVEEAAQNLHNYLNEVRRQKILDSREQIKGLADKYGADFIRELVTQKYNNQPLDYGNININDQDKVLLNEALDTINFGESLNRGEYAILDRMLANFEDEKAAQKARQGKNTSASENLNTDNQAQNLNNPSTDSEKLNSEPKTDQNKENKNEKQPQINNLSGLNISNIGDETQITNDGNYTYKATDNPDNYSVKFLDASINNKHFNNAELFDRQEGVVIMDENFKIAKDPVVDKKGNVIEKGLLVLDTEENNEIIAEEESKEEVENPTEENTTISSTGVVEQPLAPEAVGFTPVEEPTVDDKEVSQPEFEESDAVAYISDSAVEEIKAAKDEGRGIDWEGFKGKMIADLQQKGADSEAIRERLNGITDSWRKRAESKGIESLNAVAEALVRSSRIRESTPRNSEERKEFSKAVEDLLKIFNDEIGIDVVNGKKYINVEALCRYCDKVLNDKIASRKLVDNLIDLVENSNDLIATDKDILEVKNNLNSNNSIREIKSQYIGIDYNTILRDNAKTKTEEELNKFYDVVDNLKSDSSINITRERKGLSFNVNGVKIGSLPYPKEFGKAGGLYQYNDGWRTDIILGSNISMLKDLFIKWATNPNNDTSIKDLNDIILEFAYRKNDDNLSDIIKRFSNNKEIQQALKDGYIEEEPDMKRVLNGIAKIWKFTRANSHIEDYTKEELNESRGADIEQWFNERVAPSFAFVQKLKYDQNATVKINNISEGKQIITSREEALPVSKAIGTNHKGQIRLGIAEETNKITIAGNGINGSNAILWKCTRGSTFVIIPARNGAHAYVQAFPQKLTSETLGKTGKEIIKAINAEMKRIASDDSFTTDKERVLALEDFVRQLLPNRISEKYIDFTRSFYTQNKIDGCQINIDDNRKNGIKTGFAIAFKLPGDYDTTYLNVAFDGTATLSKKVNGKYNRTQLNNLNEVVNKIIETCNKCCTFNLSFAAINSDTGSVARQNITKRTPDGKFVVDIPNHEPFVFDSYNDFILNNDLVLATTKPTADGRSNFERLTDSNETTQQITVKLGAESSTPVEESNGNAASSAPQSKAILSVFNNKRVENKGFNLAKLLLDGLKKDITFNGITYNLFPKNVIFADENLGDNAITNPYDRPIVDKDYPNLLDGKPIPAKTVIVGREWLEMATSENPEIRAEAARKLIHEQLHIIIENGNQKYIEQIREIFDTFASKNTNPNLDQYLYKWDEDRYYTDGKLNQEGLEEFLVETITSRELAEALNNIAATSDGKVPAKKNESLLQRLFRVIAEMLGFNINEGSLYEKEFKLLADAFNSPVQTEIDFSNPVNQSSEQPTQKPTEPEPESVDNVLDDLVGDLFGSRITENTTNYTKEMQDIKSKAIADGTFMKAPNGNPTNLKERQWLQVRTKAFKEWFGDWEGFNKENPYHNDVTISEFHDVEGADVYGLRVVLEIANKDGFIGHFPIDAQVKPANKKLGRKEDEYYFWGGIKEGNYIDLSGIGLGISITEGLRGQGYGKAAYFECARWAANKGRILRSATFDSISESAKRVWNSLVRDGYAKKGEKRYEFINSSLINASKVVDENGEPLVVYHHTDNPDLTEFSTNFDNYFAKDGGTKEAIFFDENETGTLNRKYDIHVFLNIKDLHEYNETKEQLHQRGTTYRQVVNESAAANNIDGGIHMKDFDDNRMKHQSIWIVHNPNQIKSATDNVGTFSKEDNHIKRSRIREKESPSVHTFINEFPVQEQTKVLNQINNGEIEITCKL